MNTKRQITLLGAFAAAAVALSLLGFQQGQERTGMVNISKLIENSNLGKANTETLRSSIRRRQSLLEYLEQNTLLTREQVQRLRVLELKDGLTQAETDELAGIKASAVAAQKEFTDLNLKTSPSEADRQKLDMYNERSRNSSALVVELGQTFSTEMQAIQAQVRESETDASQKAISEAAKKLGVTIVFNSEIAPYAANDITDEAVKVMNSQ
jgi:Skp family chaperone for outer membrane proteins